MTRGRTITALLLFGLTLIVASASGQKVALVISRDILPYQSAVEGFRQACGAGTSVFNLQGDPGKGREIFSEIRGSGAQLVVAVGTEALESAVAHTKLPVVYTMVLEPKKTRTDMAGVTLDVPLAVQLRNLHAAAPGIKTVGLVYNPATGRKLADAALSACQILGLSLERVSAGSDREVAEALKPMAGKVDALWVITDPVNLSPMGSEAILLFGLANKLPILAPSEKFVKSGALLSVAADYRAVGEQTGRMVNNVLGGTSVNHLSDEQPQRFNVTLNLNVAKQIGLQIPEKVVRAATKTFQ